MDFLRILTKASQCEMSDMRQQAADLRSAALTKLEELVHNADAAQMPVIDATVVVGNMMLNHCKNQAFISYVETEIHYLVVAGGYTFERQPDGEVRFVVPKDAWALKIGATVHLHPKRTCAGMFAVLVVIKEENIDEIKVPHEALAPQLYSDDEGSGEEEEQEEEEEEEEEDWWGEEQARDHMRSKETWPRTGDRLVTDPRH